jgi:ABC-type nickel/cobalt efflux system permease component RcnA
LEFGQFVLVALTGLVLGLEHALEPDHLVAVSVFTSESKDLKAAIRLGMSWGLGHTATLLIVGGGALFLNITIPDNLAASMELLVGFLLVGLGIRVLIKLSQGKLHHHEHTHDDGDAHEHLHPHGETASHEHMHRSARQTFLVGLLHGGAGSAAAVLLVVTMVSTVWEGIFLILLFGVGSIGGMMIVSLLLGVASQYVDRIPNWQRGLNMTAGTISIVLGLSIVLHFFTAV